MRSNDSRGVQVLTNEAANKNIVNTELNVVRAHRPGAQVNWRAPGRKELLLARGAARVPLTAVGLRDGLRLGGEVEVRLAAVLGEVHAHLLNLGGDAQHAGALHPDEEDGGEAADPDEVDDEEDDLDAEQVALIASIDEAVGADLVVGVLGAAEDAGGKHAPHAAGAVDGEGVERVVDLQLCLELDRGHVDETRDDADDDGRPRVDDDAAGSDANKAGEHTVAHRRDVPHVRHDLGEEDHGERAGGRGEGGGHAHAREVARVLRGEDGERGAAVEAIPAEPEDEGSEHLQHGRVAGHRLHAARLVEAANAGSEEVGREEGGHAAGHVHDARAGEVDHPAEQAVCVEGREEARAVPHEVDDDRVDEGGERDRVDHVPSERAALGHAARDDGRRGGGEGELEEPGGPIVAFRGVGRLPVVRVNRVGAARGADEAVVAAVCDAEPDDVPDDRADARIKQVLDQDVLGVLGAHRARLEHGEAGLHEEDEASRPDQEEGIALGRERRDISRHGDAARRRADAEWFTAEQK
eukprot:CAMPEP_0179922360 /NCGR_PEP_ID=MMETSP0983-20121128/5611_1 /TAXON_ID=483367 /ORGANISM="non described non described, Strain CCMP 2436" /LENGTH=524 /DNA_ID=CAMNT_0021825729 /DNA_START=24 /DNA_END=1598 /DNA_ORIENTATION=-